MFVGLLIVIAVLGATLILVTPVFVQPENNVVIVYCPVLGCGKTLFIEIIFEFETKFAVPGGPDTLYDIPPIGAVKVAVLLKQNWPGLVNVNGGGAAMLKLKVAEDTAGRPLTTPFPVIVY